ncbi:hypothetical protein BU25DRAFT_410660 [Macroventuria anomochaeta]|uniref:Uncharacterized protein n=1 Tax=Macroventuria anomochaeta TaxID=301207 RepID=A0ACB6S028_9PLEO|nr:uncharacterized protein BU25DRAFT_410660 [Macroventuria anomochaeta]KAF2627506.1 hypothetical protein BU25DRAFT_410660 [Macroventuria anomochaeta]
MPFNSRIIKGFFGRSNDSANSKIYHLGFIWPRLSKLTADEAEAKFAEGSDSRELCGTPEEPNSWHQVSSGQVSLRAKGS